MNYQAIQSKSKRLFAGTIEQMLETEMEEHLGYEKHSQEGNNSGNFRNGYNRKTIISDYGESEIVVPRDRNGEFEPKVLGKRQIKTDEIEQKIIALSAKGMSQRDIEDNLREIYSADNPILQNIPIMTVKYYSSMNCWFLRCIAGLPWPTIDTVYFNDTKITSLGSLVSVMLH